MTPARAVGAGGAPGARSSRGAGALPGSSPDSSPDRSRDRSPDDGPVWRAHLTDGFAGRVVDDLDRPLAGALVVAVATCSTLDSRPTGAAGFTAASDRGASAAGAGSAAWFVVRTDAGGRFAMPVLPHGRHALFAVHIGPPPATSELVVVDGGFLSVPLRLVIRRGGALL